MTDFAAQMEKEIADLQELKGSGKRSRDDDNPYTVEIRKPIEGGREKPVQITEDHPGLDRNVPEEEPGFEEVESFLWQEGLLDENPEGRGRVFPPREPGSLPGDDDDESFHDADESWVTDEDDVNVTIVPDSAASSMDVSASDTFVTDLNLQDLIAAYPNTYADLLKHSSKSYQAQAGQAIQDYFAKMAGKKKKTYSKGKGNSSKTKSKGRKTPSRKGQSKDLIGFMNPFPDLNARIPDGLVVASLPHRFTNVQEFIVEESEIGHMIIFPGLDAGVLTFSTSAEFPANAPTNLRYTKYSGDESSLQGQFPPPSVPVTGTSELQGMATLQWAGDVSQWRVVSQGVRMAFISPDESNGGWFETCNLHYKLNLADWEVHSPSGNHAGSVDLVGGTSNLLITGNEAYLRPKPSIVNEYFDVAESIAEAEGFRLGTLRSIAATAFTLATWQGHHNFSSIEENYRVERGGMNWTNPGDDGDASGKDLNLGFVMSGLNESKDIVQAALDQTHDITYVRIHPATTLLGNQNCKLLVQHVANHEVVYDVDSTLHKHMIPAPKRHTAMSQAELEKAGMEVHGG